MEIKYLSVIAIAPYVFYVLKSGMTLSPCPYHHILITAALSIQFSQPSNIADLPPHFHREQCTNLHIVKGYEGN